MSDTAQDNSADQAGQVAVYMRVSGEDQRRRGTIENQRTALDRYVTAHGITPYGWYEDEAVSGRWVPFHKRPQARRLLADVEAGQVGIVLVWKLDRFGRNAREILNAVHELNAAGAQLVSMKENVDTRTSAGRFFLTVLSGVAELEYDMIMERTAAGIERRLGGGGWMGGPVPYGYRAEGTKQDAQLVIDEGPLGIPDQPDLPPNLTAAEVIRLMYRWLVEERQSTVAIADRLTQMGIPTSYQRRGRRYQRAGVAGPGQHIWRANAVRHILRNPVYKGDYTFGRRTMHHDDGSDSPRGREIVTCPVPALVSPRVWDAAAAQLEKNLLWSSRNAHHEYLLKGLMRCGLCGHLYIGDAHESGPRYVCYAHRRPQILWGRELGRERRCRKSLPLKAARIEREIWADVESYLRNPDEALMLLATELHGQQGESEAIRADLAAKQREQAAKQDERDAILAYFRKGRMTERDLDRQLDDIAREEAQLAGQIQALTARLATADDVAAKLASADTLLRELRGQLDSGPLTLERRRSILEALVESIVVDVEMDPESGLPGAPGAPGAPGKPHAVVRVTYCFQPSQAVGIATNTPALIATLAPPTSPSTWMAAPSSSGTSSSKSTPPRSCAPSCAAPAGAASPLPSAPSWTPTSPSRAATASRAACCKSLPPPAPPSPSPLKIP